PKKYLKKVGANPTPEKRPSAIHIYHANHHKPSTKTPRNRRKSPKNPIKITRHHAKKKRTQKSGCASFPYLKTALIYPK
ncbi:MAG TPA: hypothetical protein VK627_01915, partial [Edaphobacter sp.]|nr:hypothetical protein [Edaphobacter sp.]